MKEILPEITIEDFAKCDLRIAKVVEAEEVPGADKLVKLTLCVGWDVPETGEPVYKTCFAGIKKFYTPTQLIGRTVVYLANLKPRQMKFGLSEGMILAASNEDHSSVMLLSVDTELKLGQPFVEPGDTVG